MAGDAPMDFLETLALNYLGTVPVRGSNSDASPKEPMAMKVKTLYV